MDDELIGFIFKFTGNITDDLHTNLTGIHEVFKIAQDLDYIEPDFMLEDEDLS